MHDFLRFKIDDANRVVTKFCDEQPLTRDIDGHMIDAAGDTFQRYFPFELQRVRRGILCGGAIHAMHADKSGSDHVNDCQRIHDKAPYLSLQCFTQIS